MPEIQWQHEVVTLEAQLNSSVRMQIENTRDGIRKLGQAQDRIHNVRDYLANVTDLCQQSGNIIDNYPFIKQISRTHQNFALTKRVFDEFRALDANVERTAVLLEADRESGQPDNLLVVYYHLAKLDDFRTQTLALMRDAPSATIYTLKRYFKKLDDLAIAFDDFFWKLPKQLFQLALTGQGDTIVKMLKVLSRMDRTHKSRFNTILDDIVSAKFNVAMAGLGGPPSASPGDAVEALSFWQADLDVVRDELGPRFPPDYNIVDFFVLIYHRHIHAVLGQCIAGKLGPADILTLIGWVRTYHETMAAHFGISAEDLEPRLLDDREAALIADYVAQSRQKISEWITTLLHSETKAFTERAAVPDTDADLHYLTPAAVDLFQIVRQHVDAAAQASKGRLLMDIVAECCRSVGTFQKGYGRTLEAEKTRFFEKSEGVPPNFEDYVIMLGNTCLRWISYLNELTHELEGLLASEFVAQATKQLKACNDGFLALARSATQVLVDAIFRAVKPAVQQLFTQAWYSEGVVGTILATFEDFFRDYQQHADEFLFTKLVSDVLERFLLVYIDQMRSKSSKFRMQACPEVFKADLESLLKFFSAYRDAKRVEKALDALAKLVALFTSSQKMIFLEFFAFWKVYPDVPLHFIEEALSRRDDLDRAAIKEIMETCRKRTREEKIIESAPSIFSKIKV